MDSQDLVVPSEEGDLSSSSPGAEAPVIEQEEEEEASIVVKENDSGVPANNHETLLIRRVTSRQSMEKSKDEISDHVLQYVDGYEQPQDADDDEDVQTFATSSDVPLPPRPVSRSTRLSQPGAVAVVPLGSMHSRQDEDRDEELGPDTTIVATLVDPTKSGEQEEQARPPTVVAKRAKKYSKQSRILWGIVIVLIITLVVVLSTTLTRRNKGSSSNNDKDDSSSLAATTMEPTAMPAPTAPPTVGLPGTSRPPTDLTGATTLPKGKTHCGTTAWLQIDYRGLVNVTVSGRSCQPWEAQTPHEHTRLDAWFPERGLQDNYCRNPDGEERAWCYTTDPDVRWEVCDIPDCSGYCGVDLADAESSCGPTCLVDQDCPTGETCFAGANCEIPRAYDEGLYCGTDYQNAYQSCSTTCYSGYSNECKPFNRCFAQTQCLGVEQPDPTFDPVSPTEAPGDDNGITFSRENKFCGSAGYGQADYRGTINVTVSGRACQPWADQFPHTHNRKPEFLPGRGLDENYCRDPDGTGYAWCYTMDPEVRSEPCNVPYCSFCAVDAVIGVTSSCETVCLEDEQCPDGQVCRSNTGCQRPPDDTEHALFCGTSRDQASQDCVAPCPTGLSNECPPNQECFAGTSCSSGSD